MRVRLGSILLALALAIGAALPAPAQSAPCADSHAGDSETLAALARSLLCVIAQMSDYDVSGSMLPALIDQPQHVIEAKVCDEPCTVLAAFIPSEGVFLSGNLDPLRSLSDRAVLLHELVHFLQQGHAKFARLRGCARERAKEEEAYRLQNAYLAANGSEERAIFYAGDFDCAGP